MPEGLRSPCYVCPRRIENKDICMVGCKKILEYQKKLDAKADEEQSLRFDNTILESFSEEVRRFQEQSLGAH